MLFRQMSRALGMFSLTLVLALAACAQTAPNPTTISLTTTTTTSTVITASTTAPMAVSTSASASISAECEKKGCHQKIDSQGGSLQGETWKVQIPAGFLKSETVVTVRREYVKKNGLKRPPQGVRAEPMTLVIEVADPLAIKGGKSLRVTATLSPNLAAKVKKEEADWIAYYWRSVPKDEIAEWWDLKSTFNQSSSEISATVPAKAFVKGTKSFRLEILFGIE